MSWVEHCVNIVLPHVDYDTHYDHSNQWRDTYLAMLVARLFTDNMVISGSSVITNCDSYAFLSIHNRTNLTLFCEMFKKSIGNSWMRSCLNFYMKVLCIVRIKLIFIKNDILNIFKYTDWLKFYITLMRDLHVSVAPIIDYNRIQLITIDQLKIP